jgi:acyl carrier protein
MDYHAQVRSVLASMGMSLAEDGTLPEVDSLEVMNLVSQLEEAVGMMIPGEELQAKNFKTADDIVALLNRMASSGGAVPGTTE